MTSTRSIISPPPFAANALTVIPPTPVAGVSYRDQTAGPASSPDGWPYAERVNSAEWNQIMFQISSLISIMDKKGVLGWSSLVNYTEAAIQFGSDGVAYLWLQASGPSGVGAKDPVSEPAYWRPLASLATTSIAGVVELATSAEMATGTSTSLVPPVAAVMSLFSKRTFGVSDYIRIPDVPGGIIIQWGEVADNIPDATLVNLPIIFPNNLRVVIPTVRASLGIASLVSAYWDKALSTNSQILVGRRFANNGGAVGLATQGYNFIAIGN